MRSATKPRSKALGIVSQVGALEAKTHLAKLLRQARAGGRIIITQRGKPVAQLGPVEEASAKATRRWGDMKGKIWTSDDFCDELEELSPVHRSWRHCGDQRPQVAEVSRAV